MKSERLRPKIYIAAAVFSFLLVQTALVENTSGILNTAVSYADDALVCLAFPVVLFSVLSGKVSLSKNEKIILLAYVCFSAVGWISSLVNRLQPLFVAVTDFIACSRFIAFYFLTRIAIPEEKDCSELLKIINIICRALVLVMTALALHDLLFPPFFEKDGKAIDLFFTAHTELAACSVSCCSVVILSGYRSGKIKWTDVIFIFMSLFCACVTLRTKAFGGAIVISMLWLTSCVLKFKPVFELFAGAVGACGAVVLAVDKLRVYYLDNIPTARNVMFKDSIKLATQYFPVGTGYGTFGSSAAFKNMSPLYYQLKYPEFLEAGLNPWDSFLCDSFWPVVIAQNGWLGLAAFMVILACFCCTAVKTYPVNRNIFCTMMAIIAYLLISTMGETAFFHPMTASMFVILALATGLISEKSDSDGEDRVDD